MQKLINYTKLVLCMLILTIPVIVTQGLKVIEHFCETTISYIKRLSHPVANIAADSLRFVIDNSEKKPVE